MMCNFGRLMTVFANNVFIKVTQPWHLAALHCTAASAKKAAGVSSPVCSNQTPVVAAACRRSINAVTKATCDGLDHRCSLYAQEGCITDILSCDICDGQFHFQCLRPVRAREHCRISPPRFLGRVL